MSIIHDALKKVQQGLSPKKEEPPPSQTGTTQKGSSYIYATPPPTDLEPLANQKKSAQRSDILKNIKSLFTILFAMAIIAGSLGYLYQQYRQDIPSIERSAKKLFYQLIHKEELPDFKTKAPEDLVPLARITIPAAASPVSTTAQATAVPPPLAPVTLNVHGIMSNASGNLALINNQVYQVGDDVDGAKIIKIDLDSITVNINGTDKTISVNN